MENVTLATFLKLPAESVRLIFPDGSCSQNQDVSSKVLNVGCSHRWLLPEPEMAGHGLGFIVIVAVLFLFFWRPGLTTQSSVLGFYCYQETP